MIFSERTQLIEYGLCVKNLSCMILGLYLLNDIGNFSLFINYKCSSGSSHELTSVHLFLNPGAIEIVNNLLCIGQKLEW